MRNIHAMAILMAFLAMSSGARGADRAAPFSGAYVGLNAGVAWASSGYSTNPGCVSDSSNGVFCVLPPDPSSVNGPAVAASGTGDLSSTGFTGGIQGGYNWQYGSVVVGGEGDFGAFDLSKSVQTAGTFPFPFLGTNYALNEGISAHWLATLRGRLGYLVSRELLIYGTGGAAFTDVKFWSSYGDNAVSPLFPGGTGADSRDDLKIGWTLGGGGELLLDDQWSIKAEYLYVDFGSTTIAVPTANSPAYTQTMAVDADLSAHVARVGVNFRP